MDCVFKIAIWSKKHFRADCRHAGTTSSSTPDESSLFQVGISVYEKNNRLWARIIDSWSDWRNGQAWRCTVVWSQSSQLSAASYTRRVQQTVARSDLLETIGRRRKAGAAFRRAERKVDTRKFKRRAVRLAELESGPIGLQGKTETYSWANLPRANT